MDVDPKDQYPDTPALADKELDKKIKEAKQKSVAEENEETKKKHLKELKRLKRLKRVNNRLAAVHREYLPITEWKVDWALRNPKKTQAEKQAEAAAPKDEQAEEKKKNERILRKILRREVLYSSKYPTINRVYNPLLKDARCLPPDGCKDGCNCSRMVVSEIHKNISKSWDWSKILEIPLQNIEHVLGKDYAYKISYRFFDPVKTIKKDYTISFGHMESMFLQNFRPNEIVIGFKYKNGGDGFLQLLFPVRWHLVHFLMYLNAAIWRKKEKSAPKDQFKRKIPEGSDRHKYYFDINPLKKTFESGGFMLTLSEDQNTSRGNAFSSQYRYGAILFGDAFSTEPVSDPS